VLCRIQILDASLCGVSASGDALQRFFTHSLTQTLTYKPRYTVSDAVALQKEWTFARAGQLLTSLFRKLAVIFTVEQLLCQLQQVLEAHEVNWKHVLCFLSTLLVHNPLAQPALKELLSRQLTSAFESYDLENMITAFLLARQGALEGPGVFPSYTDWFKMSFSGSTGFHANNKKTLVFLLKFLSDLVPYEPSQYLKVHILHPPYVPAKHRSLLMEYVSLAKTRLADLKESVEDMGLYKDVSAAAGASAQAVQDVEKAVLLFDGTGKIPATVMEARYSRQSPRTRLRVSALSLTNISAQYFRRPYFLTRFLPALLKPRVGTLLTGAQLLGLAAFVVHLHASASHGPQVQLVPPVPAGPELVSFGDAFALALVCNTRTNMVFGVRFCLLAVCYGLCRGDSVPQPQQQRDYILSSFYKKLLHLIPRLLPEARRSPITGAGLVSDDQEENLQENLWSSTADLLSSWRKTAQHLWRLPAFRQLQHLPQYQLKVSEWLANELRIQRSEDVLSDPERVCCMPAPAVDAQLENSTKPGLTFSSAVLCSSSLQRLKAGSAPSPAPAASDFQLAASLHRAWHRHGDKSVSLNELRTKTGTQHEQVLVFLFFLCVNDYLSALLYAQLSGELQRRAARCPGFLHTAVLSYIRLLQIYLDGLELQAASQLSEHQLRSRCEDADPEVAAALWEHLSPASLSPEMDFL
ncbi:unnamed protein product, partial [Tetraodon nigroviridis]